MQEREEMLRATFLGTDGVKRNMLRMIPHITTLMIAITKECERALKA